MTGNTDEVSGTGYTAGGTALTNVDPLRPRPRRLYRLLARSVVDLGLVLDHRLHDLQHDAERPDRQRWLLGARLRRHADGRQRAPSPPSCRWRRRHGDPANHLQTFSMSRCHSNA
jgi:hypothetical protein